MLRLPNPVRPERSRRALLDRLAAPFDRLGTNGRVHVLTDPSQQRPRHRLGIGIEHDLAQHPRRGRGHFLRHLVGLELDQRIVDRDHIADALEPRAHDRLGPFLLVGNANLDAHQNPTSRSISARIRATLGTANSSRVG